MSVLILEDDGKVGRVHQASLGNKDGWAFSVTWDGRSYPNFVSALYLTKREAEDWMQKYFDSGKFETYGSAE